MVGREPLHMSIGKAVIGAVEMSAGGRVIRRQRVVGHSRVGFLHAVVAIADRNGLRWRGQLAGIEIRQIGIVKVVNESRIARDLGALTLVYTGYILLW